MYGAQSQDSTMAQPQVIIVLDLLATTCPFNDGVSRYLFRVPGFPS